MEKIIKCDVARLVKDATNILRMSTKHGFNVQPRDALALTKLFHQLTFTYSMNGNRIHLETGDEDCLPHIEFINHNGRIGYVVFEDGEWFLDEPFQGLKYMVESASKYEVKAIDGFKFEDIQVNDGFDLTIVNLIMNKQIKL
ncbi:hypothetical protein ACB087_01935 [Vibrio sp. VNB-15]